MRGGWWHAALQVLTNAGQANAATGDQGYADAVECAQALAAAMGISPDDVLLQSTGGRGGAAAAALRPTAVQQVRQLLKVLAAWLPHTPPSAPGAALPPGPPPATPTLLHPSTRLQASSAGA
jgi:hypothetical protein